MKRVRLTESADRPVGGFSHGMNQRLGVAEVLVKDCRVAILDEPTNGLDPQSTTELLGLIRQLRDDGRTILLSSHMLSLVETICDRVALIHKGRIGLTGDVDALRSHVMGGAFVIEVEATGIDLDAAFSDMQAVGRVERIDDKLVHLHAEADIRAEVARRVTERSGNLIRLAMHRPSLEDVYARYYEEVRDAA